VREVAVVSAYCGRSWGQLTDWKDASPVEPGFAGSISGMVLSEPLPLLGEESIAGIESYRRRASLVSNPVAGEGYRESRALAYLRIGSQTIGIFLERGYEGESYELHEVAGDASGRVIQVHGGGC